jgi:hypothetical protein
VRSKSSGAFILSEKAEGRGKNGGCWILNDGLGRMLVLDFEWWIAAQILFL